MAPFHLHSLLAAARFEVVARGAVRTDFATRRLWSATGPLANRVLEDGKPTPGPPPPPHPVNPPDAENPPESENPDSATLQEQWRYATRMYSKWYAHAWGTAIAAGLGFFAIGWLVKGENPLTLVTGSKKDEEAK